jgi:hypothetical protein
VNISGIRRDVNQISYFLSNAPTPAQLKSIITDIDTALQSSLVGALDALEADIDGRSSSGLALLRHQISVLTSFNTSGMALAITSYNQSISAVLNK